MRRVRNNWYILLFLLSTVSSCESDAGLVKAPEFIQKLVITSFISPSDTISYFSISSNLKIYGELSSEEPLGLISGFISDGTSEVALDTCRFGLKLNHKKMQIRYGQKYKLRISTGSGLHAEAECSVPGKRIFAIEADTFSVIKDYPAWYQPVPGTLSYRAMDFVVNFSDLSGEENYYRVFGNFTGYFRNSVTDGTLIISDLLNFNEEFLSDKGREGQNFVLRTEDNHSNLMPPNLDSMFLRIYLYNTEKSYFQFHKALNNYGDGENPFSEASPIYSNIIGGLGIFTSYTVDSLVVRLK